MSNKTYSWERVIELHLFKCRLLYEYRAFQTTEIDKLKERNMLQHSRIEKLKARIKELTSE